MKPILLLVITLLVTSVAPAAEPSVELDVNYQHAEFACGTTTTISCENLLNPDDSSPKLIHTATASVFAEPGNACQAEIEIINVTDSGGNSPPLLQAFATGQSPGQLTITFTTPILIEDRDFFRFTTGNLNAVPGGCRGQATVGVELLK